MATGIQGYKAMPPKAGLVAWYIRLVFPAGFPRLRRLEVLQSDQKGVQRCEEGGAAKVGQRPGAGRRLRVPFIRPAELSLIGSESHLHSPIHTYLVRLTSTQFN